MAKRGRKPKIQRVTEQLQENKVTEEKKKNPQPKPDKVMVNTQGHVVQINGHKFAGKVMVPREYEFTIKRLVQKRIKLDKKAKQFKEHGDKSFVVPGR